MLARSHPDTTTEIRTLLGDLQVLGRSEFKLLLKWCGSLNEDSVYCAGSRTHPQHSAEQKAVQGLGLEVSSLAP